MSNEENEARGVKRKAEESSGDVFSTSAPESVKEQIYLAPLDKLKKLEADLEANDLSLEQKTELHLRLLVEIEKKNKEVKQLELEMKEHRARRKTMEKEIAFQVERAAILPSLSLYNLPDMPNSVLIEVWYFLDIFHRQRLRRVCKKWKSGLSLRELVDHVYLDKDTFNGDSGALASQLYFEIRHMDSYDSRRKYKFKSNFDYSRVQHVTCDGLIGDTQIGEFLEKFISKCVHLQTLNLINIDLDLFLSSCWLNLIRLSVSRIPVRLVNCTTDIFTAWNGDNTFSYRQYHKIVEFAKTEMNDWRIVLQDMTVTNALNDNRAALEHLIWPYSDDSQVEWLAKHAPHLNKHPDLLKWLRSLWTHRHQDLSYFGYMMCKQHKKFCTHLDLSFYKNQMRASTRFLLAFCLIKRNLPEVALSPYQFNFVKMPKKIVKDYKAWQPMLHQPRMNDLDGGFVPDLDYDNYYDDY